MSGATAGIFGTQPATLTLTGCTNINVLTMASSVIPAGANAVMMYSTSTLTTFDLATQCSGGNVYVIFINPGSTTTPGYSASGNFANGPSTARYLRISNTIG